MPYAAALALTPASPRSNSRCDADAVRRAAPCCPQWRRRLGCLLGLRQRRSLPRGQSERELAAPHAITRHAHRAAMRVDCRLHQRQPQSRAVDAGVVSAAAPVEGFEDASGLSWIDADALVADIQSHLVVLRAQRDDDSRPFGRVLDAVVEKVANGIGHRLFIQHQQRQRARALQIEHDKAACISRSAISRLTIHAVMTRPQARTTIGKTTLA